MRITICVAALIFLQPAARADDPEPGSHALGHAYYLNWVNRDHKGCCNDQDCSALPESRQRTVEGGALEILVHGVGVAKGQSAWCPVRSYHFLSKGNAPDWSTAHACVSGHYGGKTPCEQFICFQPKPGL